MLNISALDIRGKKRSSKGENSKSLESSNEAEVVRSDSFLSQMRWTHEYKVNMKVFNFLQPTITQRNI